MAKGLRALLETLLTKEGFSRQDRLEILATNNYPTIRNHIFQLLRRIMRKARQQGRPFVNHFMIELDIAVDNVVVSSSSGELDSSSSSPSGLSSSQELPSDVRDDDDDDTNFESDGEQNGDDQVPSVSTAPITRSGTKVSRASAKQTTSQTKNTQQTKETDRFILFNLSTEEGSEDEPDHESSLSNGYSSLERAVKKSSKGRRVKGKKTDKDQTCKTRMTRSQTKVARVDVSPSSSTSQTQRACTDRRRATTSRQGSSPQAPLQSPINNVDNDSSMQRPSPSTYSNGTRVKPPRKRVKKD